MTQHIIKKIGLLKNSSGLMRLVERISRNRIVYILPYSALSFLPLAAPAAQHILRHAVLSSATLMFSSKDALANF